MLSLLLSTWLPSTWTSGSLLAQHVLLLAQETEAGGSRTAEAVGWAIVIGTVVAGVFLTLGKPDKRESDPKRF